MRAPSAAIRTVGLLVIVFLLARPLLALLTGCAHAPVPTPRCDLAALPAWQPVAIVTSPDGGVVLAPEEASKLAQDINAMRDWNRQAAACLGVSEATDGG